MGIFQNKAIFRVLRDSSIYLGANFLTKAISILLIPLLTKFLMPEQYGQILLFSTLMIFFNPAIYCGSIDLVAIDYFKTEKEFKTTLRQCNSTVFYVSIGMTLLFLLASPLLMRFFEIPFIVVIILPFTCLLSYYLELLLLLLRYRNKHMSYLGASVTKTIIETGVTLLFLLVFDWNWYSRVAGIIAGFLVAAVFLMQIVPMRSLIGKLDFASLKYIIRRGSPFIIAQVLIIAFASADKFIIPKSFGKDDLGLYGIAFQIAALFTVFSASVSSVLQPMQFRLASDINQQSKERLINLALFFIGIQLTAAILLIIVTPLVYQFFIDPKYHSGIVYVKYLVVANFFAGCSLFFVNIIRQKGRGRQFIAINLYPLVFLVVCFLILPKYFDIAGIVYSYIIVNMAVFMIALRKAQKTIELNNSMVLAQLKKFPTFK